MALASKSSATRCRARCTSRWAKRCEKAVAPGSPRCRIDCVGIICIHLWYWQSLPKPGNKVGPKPVASCTKRWRSWKQTWNWNKPQKNPSKHPTDECKNIYRNDAYQNFRMDQMFLLPGKFDWDILCTLTTNCFTAPARSWWWAQAVQTAQPEVSMGTAWLLGHVIARLVWR